ncbi:SAC3 domain-containing protein 1 [Microplitis mediator]|uniref:SAC3 domain-containing protein 1 n=1 Tax=Microplitis mediator TaxID=375433 RepID=UPI0025557AFC|nr:SAC3 domain-containing protein 1 [Microplitis mediator]
MSFESKKIIGTCFSMCSEKERCLREREGLLSILEIDEKTKNQKHKKADPAKTIKCFQRSSAGKSFADDPSELRPGPVLMLTVRYLLNKVSLRKDVDWSLIYEFTFDRIRAIRQDMIIQRLDAITSIKILEPIVKFHIYAAERMRERPLKDYVPKFNDQHLLECIKQLLVLYDEVNYASADVHEEKKPTEFEKSEQFTNRCTIEAVYLLLYLGDPSALSRGLSLPSTYRNSPVVQQALEISLGWYLKNYVRVCRKVSQLPSLLAMAVLNNIRSIRRDALEIMSAGYQSKILTFPGDKLKEILLYNDMKKVSADCKLLGVDFVENNLHFKHRLNTDSLTNPEKTFSDTQLDKLLPYIFF